jgi:hypothetical protein
VAARPRGRRARNAVGAVTYVGPILDFSPEPPERQHPYLDRFELLPPVAVPSNPSLLRHDQRCPNRVSLKARRGIKSRGDTEGWSSQARRLPVPFREGSPTAMVGDAGLPTDSRRGGCESHRRCLTWPSAGQASRWARRLSLCRPRRTPTASAKPGTLQFTGRLCTPPFPQQDNPVVAVRGSSSRFRSSRNRRRRDV